MRLRVRSEEAKERTVGGVTERWLEVVDDDTGKVLFVPVDPLNRDYRAVLEHRRRGNLRAGEDEER